MWVEGVSEVVMMPVVMPAVVSTRLWRVSTSFGSVVEAEASEVLIVASVLTVASEVVPASGITTCVVSHSICSWETAPLTSTSNNKTTGHTPSITPKA